MLPPYSKKMQAFLSVVHRVLTQPLNVYTGPRLLVDCERVHSVRISQHIVQLLFVELDKADPDRGFVVVASPAERLFKVYQYREKKKQQ